jgi:predicted GNAT superfamily acetyltransferase
MVRVRAATPADHAWVLALNNGATPHVNALDAETFARIASIAVHFTVAEDEDGPLGFVLVLPSGTDYWSDNYRWFAERYATFWYLDRVVVAPRAHRRGVGRALYEDLFERAAERITLEVNRRPPNPGSEAFHLAVGFHEVGVRAYDAGAHAVVMMVRERASA